jgi:hypothetical protein
MQTLQKKKIVMKTIKKVQALKSPSSGTPPKKKVSKFIRLVVFIFGP